MTLASAGSATEVVVGATLAFTAAPDVTLNPQFYAIEWSVDDETYGTLDETEGLTNVLNGVAAGTVTVTSEIKAVDYVLGARTLVSLETPITDSIEITVSES